MKHFILGKGYMSQVIHFITNINTAAHLKSSLLFPYLFINDRPLRIRVLGIFYDFTVTVRHRIGF